MVPTTSENSDWLSVLGYSTVLAFPFAIQAASKLNVFELLHEHGPLSAQQLIPLLPRPVSNPRACQFLDRLLHLLSSPSPALPHPLLAVSISPDPPSTLLYSLLPPARYFLKNEHGIAIGAFISQQVLTFVDTFRHLDSVIVDGGDGFHKEFGHKVSHHVAEHASEMDMVMSSATDMLMKQWLDVYDGFKDVGTLVDVGGCTGYTLVHILNKHPHIQGINLDQPHIVAKGVTHPRLKHVGGNMLESVPPADAFILKLVLHDWEDDECITILKNCKKASTSDHGKVIVAEYHVPELVKDAAPKHHFDIIMMSSHGGKMRTPTDYKSLGQGAGFSDMKLACIVNEYAILEFQM